MECSMVLVFEIKCLGKLTTVNDQAGSYMGRTRDCNFTQKKRLKRAEHEPSGQLKWKWTLKGGMVGCVRSSPVRKSHALKEFGQWSVYGEVRHASFAKVIGLTGLFVDSVEVVAFLRRVLAMGWRHHEVSAVDDLRLPPVWSPQPQVGLFSVRIVFLLLLYARRRATVFLPYRHLSNSHVGNTTANS